MEAVRTGKEEMDDLVRILNKLAYKKFKEGQPLTYEEESFRAEAIKTVSAIGRSLKLTERELVALLVFGGGVMKD